MERLRWWEKESLGILESQPDECLDHFKEEWLGRRSDGAGRAACATRLWELTRDLCSSPSINNEQSSELIAMLSKALPDESRDTFEQAGLIDRDLKGYNASLLNPVRKAIERLLGASKEARKISLQQLALLKAQIHTAHAALQIVEAQDLFAMELMIQSAIFFANAHGNSLEWVDAQTAPPPLAEQLKDRFVRLLNQLHLGFTHDANEQPAVRRALLELERGVVWMLGMSDPEQQSRELIIPLVGKKKCPETDEVVEHGSLAVLRVKRFVPIIDGAKIGAPLLIADPVKRGLLAFGSDWHQAFSDAVRWAGAGENSNAILMYELDFHFFSLAQNNQVEHSKRPSIIKGSSASLAAALLARATLEQRDVNREACVTGKIASDSGDLGTITGVLQKADGYQDILAKHYRNSLFLAGPTEDKDKEVINTLNQIDGFPGIQRIDSVDAAYDRVTGEVDLVRIYAAVELHRVSNQVEQFVPKRLQEQFNRVLSAKGIKIADLSILDELTMEQTVVEDFALSEKESSTKSDRDSNPALDELLLQFTNQSEFKTAFKLLGGPGMGKTWAGLRWHLKLIAKFWERLTGHPNKSTENETGRNLFSVWITVRELQDRIVNDEGLRLPELLCEILQHRTRNLISRDGSSSVSKESFQRFLNRQFDSCNVVLIVDSWDERLRDSKAERLAREELRSWHGAGNGLVLTSRRIGESSQSGDPLEFLSRESTAWVINPNQSAETTIAFMSRWFGDKYADFEDELNKILANQSLDDLCRVPQLAALLCWFVEDGRKLPEGKIRPGILLREVVKAILLKYMRAKENDLDSAVSSAIEDGDFLQMLQLLAFRTFDGSRWVISRQELKKELKNPVYDSFREDWSCQNIGVLARHIENCGLFCKNEEKFNVVHQSLAEVLVAGHLTSLDIEFGSQLSLDDATSLALRWGLLDAKWKNTWRYYSSLKDATQFIEFLIFLSEQYSMHPIPRTLATESGALLLACAGDAAVATGSKSIGRFSSQITENLVHEIAAPDQYETYMWYAGIIPRFLHARVQACTNLAYAGYDSKLRALVGNADDGKSDQVEELKSRIASLFLFHAGKLELSNLWRVFRRTAFHGGSRNDCSREKRVDRLVQATAGRFVNQFLKWEIELFDEGKSSQSHLRYLIRRADGEELFQSKVLPVLNQYLKGADSLSELEFLTNCLGRIATAREFDQSDARFNFEVTVRGVDLIFGNLVGEAIGNLEISGLRNQMYRLSTSSSELIRSIGDSLRWLETSKSISLENGSRVADLYASERAKLKNDSTISSGTDGFERFWTSSKKLDFDATREALREELISFAENVFPKSGYSGATATMLIGSYVAMCGDEWRTVWNDEEYLWELTDKDFEEVVGCTREGYFYGSTDYFGESSTPDYDAIHTIGNQWEKANPRPYIPPFDAKLDWLNCRRARLAFCYSIETIDQLSQILSATSWLIQNKTPWHWPNSGFEENGVEFEGLGLGELMANKNAVLISLKKMATHGSFPLNQADNVTIHDLRFDLLLANTELAKLADFAKTCTRLNTMGDDYWKDAYLP